MTSWNKFPDVKPPRAGAYLACLGGGMPFIASYIMQSPVYPDGVWRHYDDPAGRLRTVTHWMELPKPPI